MASIYKELIVAASAEHVWAAIRDVGAVHTRFARDMVLDTRLDGNDRTVTFANGEVVRERIVGIDDQRHRLAYAVVEWRTTHHNASFQVVQEGKARCRLVWIPTCCPTPWRISSRASSIRVAQPSSGRWRRRSAAIPHPAQPCEDRLLHRCSLARSRETSSGSSKAGRTNARAFGKTRSSASPSQTRSAMSGAASASLTTPRSTSSRHAACDRSIPSSATFAEPS